MHGISVSAHDTDVTVCLISFACAVLHILTPSIDITIVVPCGSTFVHANHTVKPEYKSDSYCYTNIPLRTHYCTQVREQNVGRKNK